ncbi:MAG: hypothetical protein LBJ87_09300 [bacterium]|jgi:hypothetical protein|nr:hypothetical protein [bacterium]
MAQQAFGYTSQFIEQAQSKERVRQDDVLPLLVPALEVCPPLRDFLAEHRLTQKYWYRYFAELILDRVWADLKGEQKD